VQSNAWLIIQAGGLGSRMRPLTNNRPKCLVPVGGETILSNAINVFGDQIIVIGDYLFDVLKNYVKTLYPHIKLVKANEKGTCAGLKESLELIGDHDPFVYMWSDLYFESAPVLDFSKTTIGLSRTFPCRYQYEDATYKKVSGTSSGIAGFFSFPNKSFLSSVPHEGSFVGEFLKNTNFNFDKSIWLDNTHEIGTIEALKNFESTKTKSRFFNEVTVLANSVTKRVKDERFLHLIDNERRWYKKIESIGGFEEVPKLINDEPLQIEYRDGDHPYKLSFDERKKSLIAISEFLNKMHKHETSKVNNDDLYQMYLQKTLDRTVRYASLIDGFDEHTLKINGTSCENPFYHQDSIRKIYEKIKCKSFCLIHGDLTFSNCLWDLASEKLSVFDPRGVFGKSKIIGDPAYDWAKVYYSAVDCYDITNTREFSLVKDSNNEWIIPEIDKEMDSLFWDLCPFEKDQIMIRLSFIWFSLIGYLENDLDSMNLSFKKGCLSLKNVETK
jgi:GTP:adenosylcobinamide-phosphate guanylyltransferase